MQFKATIFAALMGFAMLASLDANAAKQCINSHDGTMESRKNPRVGPNATLYGSICDIWLTPKPQVQVPQPTPTHKKPRWTLCINGVDLKTGGPCWDHGHGHGHGHGWHHGHRPTYPITIRGPQAFDVLRNGYILQSDITWDGWSVYLVKYFGHGNTRLYRCRVSPNGNWAECRPRNTNKWSR